MSPENSECCMELNQSGPCQVSTLISVAAQQERGSNLST